MQAGHEEHVYTVSELNRCARNALETGFGGIWLKGEISEMTRAASGHLYFTLKDDDAEISAVRFRSRSSAFTPVLVEQGMVVLALGNLTVYEPRGRYQFIATLLQPLGEGELQAAIERLKARLQAEGLFAQEHKKPIPHFPRRIGLVTSPSGAAVRDVRSVLSRRWPIADLFLFAATVQGAAAPEDLIEAIDSARRFSEAGEPLDVLIVSRGGGSAEDLAAFSDERVVRAVFDCPIPVVSAVGHEIDFALADFAADLRAPTPSAAAELVAPDRDELIDWIVSQAAQCRRAVAQRLDGSSTRLHSFLRGYLLRLPIRRAETLTQRLDGCVENLNRSLNERRTDRARRLARAEDVLRLSDPGRPLRRGYSLTYLQGQTEPIRDASILTPGSAIETQLAEGRLTSRVEEVIHE